ncbi:M48 family metallopeptidase [Mucilaginibacter sp. HMF5004]|uniref:M48 family metallopeptidase n=1 Tax=Mucilaginibacter rivuli TaxID=2857527 RepID=UPI001C5F789D|nr:M48 family metallopeptidase [Mucilaginibacter rivuli]MBW4891414.1 M48 family metallopeptidase [Mucilaginibacter rivuli]
MKTFSTKIIVTALVVAAISSCTTVPITGRKQFNTVSDAEVNQSAATSYSQLLSSPQTVVVRTGTDAQRVKLIGARLSSAIEKYLNTNGYSNQYNFNWEFNLIQSKEVNAWCMPGGKVAVYSGILPVTQNDAGLATVLAHEIGHAVAHHSAERISQQMVAQGVGGILGASTTGGTATAINQLYGIGGGLVLLSYSRNQESEADRLGLTFMAMAGYDPHEALNFWNRMMTASKNGGGTPEFLSDHPSDQKRITDIQARLPEAMKYYTK